MPRNINYQNTANVVKVPFPPSISVDEIVQIHLKNDIKNVNETMNAFMIYRKEYNNIVANSNLSSKDVSKFVSISWKNEPEDVKTYYRQMAKNVKKCFKEKVPSLYFVNSNQVDSTNDNDISLDTVNNLPPQVIEPNDLQQNFLNSTHFTYFNLPPSNTDQNAEHQFLNIEQSSQESTWFNPPPSNTDQNVNQPFLNIEQTSQDSDHPLLNIEQSFPDSTYFNLSPSNTDHLFLIVEQTSQDSTYFNLPPSNTNQNSDHQLLNMEQSSLDSTYFNLSPSNTDHQFLNVEQTSLDSTYFNLPPSNTDHQFLNVEQTSLDSTYFNPPYGPKR